MWTIAARVRGARTTLEGSEIGIMDDPAIYLTAKDVAARIHVSEKTLERMRRDGDGPRYVKAGRRCLYRVQDLDAWLVGRCFGTTAEARRAGVK